MIKGLADCSNAIMGIRDSIGASQKQIWFVCRSWGGSEIGEGRAKDTETRLIDTPYIVDLSLNFRALEGGNVKQGDLLLKMVNKHRYPDRCVFGPTTEHKNKEIFLRIGDILYTVIAVRERHLQWDIQVRPLSSQKRYQ